MPTKTDAPAPHADTTEAASVQRPSSGGAAGLAAEIVAGTAAQGVDHYVRGLAADKDSVIAQAARVLEEVANLKPELLSAYVERFASLLGSSHVRAVSCAAHVLPLLARVAPAKVAKHLPALQASFESVSEPAQEGLLRTFVALCVASVTYQKRLILVFESALRGADPKALARWAQLVLPALKGEPYAQARVVVEQRLADPDLPRPVAQRVADLLGVKLRMPTR